MYIDYCRLESIYDFGKGDIPASKLLEGFVKIYSEIKNLGSPKDFLKETYLERTEFYNDLKFGYRRLYFLRKNMGVRYEKFKNGIIPVDDILKDGKFPNRGFNPLFLKNLSRCNHNPDRVKTIYSYKVNELKQVDSEYCAVKWICDIDIEDIVKLDKKPSNKEIKNWEDKGYLINEKKIYRGKKYPFDSIPFTITFENKLDKSWAKKYWELNESIVKNSLDSLLIFNKNNELAFVYGKKRILFDLKYHKNLIASFESKNIRI